MASFKTHIGGGAALGTAVGAVSFGIGLVGSSVGLAPLMALAVAVGSVAPDVDSDTSIPFHATFGILSFAAGGAMLVHLMDYFPGDWLKIKGISAATVIFVWLVVGAIFKKFTRHRGMVHSIPAAVLAALVIFISVTRFNVTEWQAFLVAVSFCLGYILHLVLDEIYAAVNFHGLKFAPKKSFGSALKLFSKSRSANVATYAAIAVIMTLNHKTLLTLMRKLVGLVR